jgi:hypothetical protein
MYRFKTKGYTIGICCFSANHAAWRIYGKQLIGLGIRINVSNCDRQEQLQNTKAKSYK